MAAPPPDSSYAPPDTPVNETPFLDDPMEDLDPQATRKRPRLDSGSGVSPTLSLDGTSRTASVAPASDMDEASDSSRVASKVTINMKSPLLPAHDSPESQLPAHPSKLQPDADGAPAIEVAEPEDIDQDPGSSNWRPLEHVVQDQDDLEVIEIHDAPTLADIFPKLDEDMTHRENFKALGEMIELGEQSMYPTPCIMRNTNFKFLGHQRETQALFAVKRWMTTCTQELDRLTLEEFTADLEFWEFMPHVVECLLRRRPQLDLERVEDPWAFFEELLLDFSRIVLHLVRLDTSILSRLNGHSGIDPPMSTSRRYLSTFSWVFNSPLAPFFSTLNDQYHLETLNLIARLKDQVTSHPFDAPGALLQYISHVLALLPELPSVFTNIAIIMSNTLLFFQFWFDNSKKGLPGSVVTVPSVDVNLQTLYETTQAVDKAYQAMVAKKVQVITSELSAQLLGVLYRTYEFLCSTEPDFMFELARDLGMVLPTDTDLAQTQMCVISTWKVDALKKQIMAGRMELRVNGVESLQSDLVNLWTNQFSRNGSLQFMQYMVKLLREIKILEYLMGIDSHPQLIARASNVFGFLIVTGDYDNYITDVIWKTVTDCQDDRTFSEVIAMLTRTVNMHPSRSSALVYVCEKLIELPLQRFDARILELCQQLLLRTQESPYDLDYRVIANRDNETIPLKLCVRLVRESAAADLPLEKKEMLQQFGRQQLVKSARTGLSEEDKTDTYTGCIQDIAAMNSYTAGSIQVLNALVSCEGSRELGRLANDFDLTHLVITELRQFVDQLDTISDNLSLQHAFHSRVDLLQRIIEFAPETITPELANTVWKEILMSDKLAHNERLIIWKMMQNATKTSRANPFIERCINEYLPDVLPKSYSHEILWFAQQSVHYDIRVQVPSPAHEDEVIVVPGMDRIWNFILTAPPNTIENDAIKFAINLYLDHGIMGRSPASAVDATHIALVGRCVDQLKSAASSLKPPCNGVATTDGPMDVDPYNERLGTEELVFSRSLEFLRQLLHGLRTRPQFSSPRSESGSPPSFSHLQPKGEVVYIRYQCFGVAGQHAQRTMQIGDLSTAGELVDRLTQLTRFSKFITIFGGQKLDLLQNPNTLLKDLNLGSGLLLVKKNDDAEIITPTPWNRPMTAVDKEVLKHFDELYDLLGLKDDLARQIIDFLVAFPPQGQALELVRSTNNSEKEIFPLKTPFKALYSLNTLMTCLREMSLAVEINSDFVSHSIEVLVAFLTMDELLNSLTGGSITMVLASRAIECLLLAIPVHHPTETSAVLIPDMTSLVPRVLSLLEIGRGEHAAGQATLFTRNLVCHSFGILIEGSLRDQNIWNTVKAQVNFDSLVSSLLLCENDRPVRRDIVERLKMLAGTVKSKQMPASPSSGELPTKESPLRIDMLATIWSAFVNNIPQTCEVANQSEEFFTASLFIFSSVAERSPRDVVLSEYMKEWTAVLLEHETKEYVGRETADALVLGLSAHLELCLELAINANVPLESEHIAEQLLNKYLFPDFMPEGGNFADLRTPMMHSYTRQRLYHVVTLLCQQSDETYGRIVELLDSMVPRDSSYMENSFDRHMMIRSPKGYAGLKNLSNTCYLNSLMTQLFMNVDFRDFILKLQIADPVSQKLLSETQKLFTWMQETWRRSVEPSDFVESILTYDNEQIDVGIQMDVDEFYNLLFDRWEGQILDSEKKKSFRSFYGGQLVQQIKSMECDHISEREEPFSAIQCEIKGKASLEESLRAYVAGEVMQGDNKYSCTSCGRHVDAVKRACLKDVPDNLIFHLKRFDFDMLTMLRSKINDEFRFSDLIDMAPYTVEHLSHPDQPAEPDMFELVGVLVHSGTAESGHYYSYTRERPSLGQEASWVEFNDSEVSEFHPHSIPSHCFGGVEQPKSMNNSRAKPWNAYMLFYQRVSETEESKAAQKTPKPRVPVHVPVSLSMKNYIAMDNELLIRTYCLLDPQYAFFVDGLLRRWSNMALGDNKLKAESFAVDVGMDTMEQLISRTKDLHGLEDIHRSLSDMVTSSSGAAQSVLRWVSDRESSMQNLMTKTPVQDVRTRHFSLIHRALGRLHSLSTDPDADDDDRLGWRLELEAAVERIVPLVTEVWSTVQALPRYWEDFFGFLNKTCTYGPSVVQIVLDQGVLLTCLHILWIDQEDRKGLQNRHPNYVRAMEKGRRFSYSGLLSLCLTLFKHIDLSLEPSSIGENRQMLAETGKLSIRECELEFITPLDPDGSLSLLSKIFKHWSVSRTPYARGILAVFLDGEPEAGFLNVIQKSLENGLRTDPAIQCVSYLEATVVFCQHCPYQARVAEMINFVANGIDTIDSSGGQEHLDFFIQVCDITNRRLGLGRRDFSKISLNHLPTFAPTLLIDMGESVRHNTRAFLDEVFAGTKDEATAHMDNELNGEANDSGSLSNIIVGEERIALGRRLQVSCADRLQKSFMKEGLRHIDHRQLESILAIINYCLTTFYGDSEDDMIEVQKTRDLLSDLQTMSLQEIQDDPASESDVASGEEWEGQSGMASDSDIGVRGSP
ncbi:Protein of unknown function DUF3517 [Penicillium brevicompactum]|uniref:Protein of unknown function DUF3517 n=1 Tax=Penicillium brevicompactum TaxID=5074 RepID=UPI0025425520|nr:Protein of unknown function DUF3517 [Penicillium brevicompactum]KAJ5336162.1 Protein of unknown function DUF3517 [Penicillium brevicompactum]